MLSVSWDTIRLFLHVLAATIWVGGQITLAALVPVLRRLGAPGPAYPLPLAPPFALPLAPRFPWRPWPCVPGALGPAFPRHPDPPVRKRAGQGR